MNKRNLNLILVFLVTFGVVYFITLRFFPSEKNESPATTPTGTPATGGVTFEDNGRKLRATGVVETFSDPLLSPATHRLVDPSGKLLVLLFSNKIDLNFTVPGMSVEVSGELFKSFPNGESLIKVESLSYKSGN